MTYPRYNNGYFDDGHEVNTHVKDKRCPNCGGRNYRETVSLESCSDCGLRCDYWGGGANEVYERMIARNHAAAEAERERRDREQDWYCDY